MDLFNNKIICFNCSNELDLSPGDKVMRSEECPKCYGSVHSCKMCHFYDKNAYNECKEPSADRIVDKEMANFCDYFVLKGSDNNSGSGNETDAANALFKN